MSTPDTIRVPGSEKNPATLHQGEHLFSKQGDVAVYARQVSGVYQVFHHDFGSSTTTQVTLTGGGSGADGDTFPVSLSPDGERLMMRTWATNLVGSVPPYPQMIYRDVTTSQGTFELVSQDGNGNPSDAYCTFGDMDSSGNYFVFQSAASNLTSSVSGSYQQIFLYDRSLGTARLLSEEGGSEGNGPSFHPTISDNDKWVAFGTEASNLMNILSGSHQQILLRERSSGNFHLASSQKGGGEADAPCEHPSIDEKGERVVFLSRATNLHGAVSSSQASQVYVYDRTTDQRFLISQNMNDQPSSESCHNPVISSSGDQICFETSAPSFVYQSDRQVLYAEDLSNSDGLIPVSLTENQLEPDDDSRLASFSRDGSDILFESAAENLVAADSNTERDVFIRRDWASLKTAPKAVFEIDQFSSILDPVYLDGSLSKDNDQRSSSLSYEWSLSKKPSGATASFSGKTSQTSRLYLDPDNLGTYEIKLKVTDEVDQTDSMTRDLEIKLPEASLSASGGVSLEPSIHFSGTQFWNAEAQVHDAFEGVMSIKGIATLRENPTLEATLSSGSSSSLTASFSRVVFKNGSSSFSGVASTTMTSEKITISLKSASLSMTGRTTPSFGPSVINGEVREGSTDWISEGFFMKQVASVSMDSSASTDMNAITS